MSHTGVKNAVWCSFTSLGRKNMVVAFSACIGYLTSVGLFRFVLTFCILAVCVHCICLLPVSGVGLIKNNNNNIFPVR